MTCAQGLLRLLWGGPEVGVLRDCQRRRGGRGEAQRLEHFREVFEVSKCCIVVQFLVQM